MAANRIKDIRIYPLPMTVSAELLRRQLVSQQQIICPWTRTLRPLQPLLELYARLRYKKISK